MDLHCYRLHCAQCGLYRSVVLLARLIAVLGKAGMAAAQHFFPYRSLSPHRHSRQPCRVCRPCRYRGCQVDSATFGALSLAHVIPAYRPPLGPAGIFLCIILCCAQRVVVSFTQSAEVVSHTRFQLSPNHHHRRRNCGHTSHGRTRKRPGLWLPGCRVLR